MPTRIHCSQALHLEHGECATSHRVPRCGVKSKGAVTLPLCSTLFNFGCVISPSSQQQNLWRAGTDSWQRTGPSCRRLWRQPLEAGVERSIQLRQSIHSSEHLQQKLQGPECEPPMLYIKEWVPLSVSCHFGVAFSLSNLLFYHSYYHDLCPQTSWYTEGISRNRQNADS